MRAEPLSTFWPGMSDWCFAMDKSRLNVTIDLDAPGKHVGDVLLRWSDDARPLGVYPIPIAAIVNGEGPTALLVGGIHGDEFEGPVALSRLIAETGPECIRGRLIILPMVNSPAVMTSRRTSPLDGGNLNRAFPGDPDGGPTAMLADFLASVLLPAADIAIDLHAGGKASVFATSALAARSEDRQLMRANLDLAAAFGAPFTWLLGELNDSRSLNAAALAARVPMIAAELGGGGGSDPEQVSRALCGVRRCLSHAGILSAGVPASSRPPGLMVELISVRDNIYAPVTGLFDRRFAAGDRVAAGQLAGYMHQVERLDAAPIPLRFTADSIVLAHANRGLVERGDMIAIVVGEVADVPNVGWGVPEGARRASREREEGSP